MFAGLYWSKNIPFPKNNRSAVFNTDGVQPSGRVRARVAPTDLPTQVGLQIHVECTQERAYAL